MATYSGTVRGGALNLRKSCSTSAAKVASIPNGTALSVVPVSGNRDWMYTSYSGQAGYVLAPYIAVTTGASTCTVTTSSGSLNIRQTPSTSGTKLYAAAKGTTLYVLDTTSVSGWYQVSSSSGTGWAVSSYLTMGGNSGGGSGGSGSGGDSGGGTSSNTRTDGVINHTSYVNIRQEPNGTIIGRLFPGDPFVYDASKSYTAGGYRWYKIEFDGDAYIRADYVSADTANRVVVKAITYSPDAAVNYGYYHTDNTGSSDSCASHNTTFGYISSGDCANFVSQCLCAGGLPMFDGWSYPVTGISGSWDTYNWKHTNATRCALIAKGRISSIDCTEVKKGDIIYTYDSSKSNYNDRYTHVVIAAADYDSSSGTCKVHGHTENKRAWDKPLVASKCKCYRVCTAIKVEQCEKRVSLPSTGSGATAQS